MVTRPNTHPKLTAFLLVSFVCVFGVTAFGQTAATERLSLVDTKPGGASSSSVQKEVAGITGDSIISPDDVLDIYVMDVADLSRQYRVSPTGKLVLPLLPEPVTAAGLMPTQLSEALAKQLRDNGLVMNPHIVVTIVNSRLKSVAITGAVKMPQIYPVFGKTTLLDVLSQAQGLADDASNVGIVSRGTIGEQATGQTTQTADLKRLLQSPSPEDNIDIYPGDRVTVPHAGVVYVVGAVNKPGGFMMKSSNGVTVLQALAMAQDATLTALKGKAMIIRPNPKAPEGHEQIPVNLTMVLQGKQRDQVMAADDILYIPDSSAKRALQNGARAALQAATLLAVYRP